MLNIWLSREESYKEVIGKQLYATGNQDAAAKEILI